MDNLKKLILNQQTIQNTTKNYRQKGMFYPIPQKKQYQVTIDL